MRTDQMDQSTIRWCFLWQQIKRSHYVKHIFILGNIKNGSDTVNLKECILQITVSALYGYPVFVHVKQTKPFIWVPGSDIFLIQNQITLPWSYGICKYLWIKSSRVIWKSLSRNILQLTQETLQYNLGYSHIKVTLIKSCYLSSCESYAAKEAHASFLWCILM